MLFTVMRKGLNMSDRANKIVDEIRKLIEEIESDDHGYFGMNDYSTGCIDGLKMALDQALMVADGVK
jgi:hypothetical protein